MKTELRIGQSIFLIATSVGYKKITADAISNGTVLVTEQRFYRPTVAGGSDNPFLHTLENDVTKFVEYESIKTVRSLNERGMVDIEVLEYNFDSNEYGDTVIEQEFVACSYNELQAIFDILKDDKFEAKKRSKILASLAIAEEEAKEIQSLVWLSEDSKLAELINKCAMTAFVINHREWGGDSHAAAAKYLRELNSATHCPLFYDLMFNAVKSAHKMIYGKTID